MISADNNPYTGGSGFIRGANATNVPFYEAWTTPTYFPDSDRGFITYVDAIPEPSSGLLGAFGLSLIWRRRRMC